MEYHLFLDCGPFLESLLNLFPRCFFFMIWFFWLKGVWGLGSLTKD